MIDRSAIHKINDYLWEIPRSYRNDMRVPAFIYALDAMVDAMTSDRTLEQLINVATLPGIVKAAIVMPDGHEGYGFPIGGVAAIKWPDGIISPGGIGYDINCGVRLLTSTATYGEIKALLPALSEELDRQIPSGVGRGGFLDLSLKDMDHVLQSGALWAVENGYGFPEDLHHIESGGTLANADPRSVSAHAKQRGHDQLGTIGAGNHFVEVDRVETIYNEAIAEVFELFKDQIVFLTHTGSRGLGHQVATDYLRLFLNKMPDYELHPVDRELACAPFNSIDGQHYFNAMASAANFAWCNREVISWEIRKAWTNITGQPGSELHLLYDVAHNIAKVENHDVDGDVTKLILHRKGATRAFGPGHAEIPTDFREAGQPVLIPGSMGTYSYVLAGSAVGMKKTFGSTCHGAGRRLSRRAAKKKVNAPSLMQELVKDGIYVQAGSYAGLAEEAPIAYKDINDVVETVHRAEIAVKIARLRPVCVVKG